MGGSCEVDMNLTRIEGHWGYRGEMCGYAIEVTLPEEYGTA